MKIFGLYIISEGGAILFSKIYQAPESVPSEVLLSSLLTAFQAIASNFSKDSDPSIKLSFNDVDYHIRNFGELKVVLSTNVDAKVGPIMNKIGRQFLHEYGMELINWKGNISMFFKFEDRLNQFFGELLTKDESGQINPTKILNTFSLLKIDKYLKKTSTSIFTLQEASAEEIAYEGGETIEEVENNLRELQAEGYLGSMHRKGSLVYFC